MSYEKLRDNFSSFNAVESMVGRYSFITDESFCRPKLGPSGHDISGNFANDNVDTIPSNLREEVPNAGSNSPPDRH